MPCRAQPVRRQGLRSEGVAKSHMHRKELETLDRAPAEHRSGLEVESCLAPRYAVSHARKQPPAFLQHPCTRMLCTDYHRWLLNAPDMIVHEHSVPHIVCLPVCRATCDSHLQSTRQMSDESHLALHPRLQGTKWIQIKCTNVLAPAVQPKDWGIQMNKKERRLALATALQSATANTVIVQDLKVSFLTQSPALKNAVLSLSTAFRQPAKGLQPKRLAHSSAQLKSHGLIS